MTSVPSEPPIDALHAELARLREENERLQREARGVAMANVHAASEMVEMAEARQRDLEGQKAALERALDAERDVSRHKGEFMAMISHELRTPMHGVLGMLSLLRSSGLGGSQRECVEVAVESTLHLRRIIDDILDYSKLEARKLTLVAEDADPWLVVEEVARLLASRVDPSRLDFGVRIATDVPRLIHVDVLRLRQILLNLCGNALRHTDEGEVELRVTSLDGGAAIRFEIRDTGCGIDPAFLPRLFEVFTQEDGSLSRRAGGTGLGLAISQGFVGQMGSEIQVESEKGEGSRFWFDLPGGGAESPIPESSSEGLAEARHVICVTRSWLAGDAVERHLSALGHRVEVLDDAEAGWRSLVRSPRSATSDPILLFDYELCRDDPRWLAGERVLPAEAPAFLFVLLSATGVLIPQFVLDRFSPVDVLSKPIRPSRLASWVGDLPRRAAEARERVAAKPAGPGSEPSIAGGGLRVLVAEDNRVNQLVMRKCLERLGCRVEVAANGLEAVQCADRERYDVILMDCQMPEMDGFEAACMIRTGTEGPNATTPIVAVTANAMPSLGEECRTAGIDDYLAKPFRPEELTELLDRLLPPRDRLAS